MTVYPDPSLIVAAFVEEPNSAVAKAFLVDLPKGGVLTSWWTHTEVTSALGVKARAGTLDPESRPAVLLAVHDILRRAAVNVTPIASDFE